MYSYKVFEHLLSEKKVKAADVARATGISTATLSSWKAGRYQPKSDKMGLIADYFGVSPEIFSAGQQSDVGFVAKIPRISLEKIHGVERAKALRNEFVRSLDSVIDAVLDTISDFEWELLACYHAADPGTRAAVRKLLDIQEEDTIPYPDQEVNETMPIAAHADDDATPEELEADVNILKNHVGVDVSGTDTVRRTD